MTSAHRARHFLGGDTLPRRLAAVLMLLLLLAFTCLGSPALARADEAEVRVLGRLPLHLTAAEQQEFEMKTFALAEITRKKDKVISYSCNSDIEHSGVYVFDETWPSEAALQAHLDTDHFKAWWKWVQPHLDGSLVIGISPADSFHTL